MSGKIAYAEVENYHVLRLEGKITFSDVTSLHLFIETKVRSDSHFIIDLTKCKYLDSTALGVLALIAKLSPDRTNKPKAYIANEIIRETLMGVCFDLIFEIIFCDIDINENFNFYDSERKAEENVQDTIVSAHQALAALSSKNKDMFKDVNEILKSEVS